jgi:F0F1-type ATP synthase membrane subunit b/b'
MLTNFVFRAFCWNHLMTISTYLWQVPSFHLFWWLLFFTVYQPMESVLSLFH